MDEMNKLPEEEGASKTESADTSESAMQTPAPKSPKTKLPLIIGGIVAVLAVLALVLVLILGGRKHEHSFGEWQIVDKPTCLAAGIEERICKCGEKEMRGVDALGHLEVVDTAVSSTCATTGLTNGLHCSRCSKIIVPQLTIGKISHKYSSSTDTECNNCGAIREIACKHTYDDEYDDTCNQCGFVRDAEDPPSVSGESTQGVVYDISPDGTSAEVIAYEGTATDIVIASEYNGLPVTKIYGYVFQYKRNITSIVIPDTIKYIDKWAFSYCSVRSITIGAGVIEIPDGAFYECYRLENVYMGDNIIYVGRDAFENCDNLKFNVYENCKYLGSKSNPYMVLMTTDKSNYSTYKIHADTKVIANYAFYDCSRLSNIVIPDSVTSIGKQAFSDCDYLTYIYIPKTVKYISKYAFSDCDSLEIFCESQSKPSGWDSDWNESNSSNIPVVWGYTKE